MEIKVRPAQKDGHPAWVLKIFVLGVISLGRKLMISSKKEDSKI
jgi:hypothetical protein